MIDKICKNCKYMVIDENKDNVCVNGESYNCTEFMNEHDTCKNWSKKHD